MAKKVTSGVNKSQAVRDLLQSNPNMMPKEIVSALKKSGIAISSAFVSIIKSKLKGGTAKKSVKVAKPAPAAGGGALDSLTAAVEFIRRVGGLDAARQALSTIEQIKGL